MQPAVLLAIWETHHDSLNERLQRAFLERPEVTELCALPDHVARISVESNKKLVDALIYAKERVLAIEGQDPTTTDATGDQGSSTVLSPSSGHGESRSQGLGQESNHPVVKELRAYRRRCAGSSPVFLIFTNATLDALVGNWPTTIDELLQVGGIGPHRADQFGADILAILASHQRPADALSFSEEETDGVEGPRQSTALHPLEPHVDGGRTGISNDDVPDSILRQLDSIRSEESDGDGWFDSLGEDGYLYDKHYPDDGDCEDDEEDPDQELIDAGLYKCRRCRTWYPIEYYQYRFGGGIRVAKRCRECRLKE